MWSLSITGCGLLPIARLKLDTVVSERILPSLQVSRTWSYICTKISPLDSPAVPTIASGSPFKMVPKSRMISTKLSTTLSKTSLSKSGAVPNSTLTRFEEGISNVPNTATTSGKSTISTSIEDESIA